MAKLRYCALCQRNVEAKKGFNWLVFIFLLGIPYLLFYMLFKRRRCPICKGAKHLGVARFASGNSGGVHIHQSIGGGSGTGG